VRHPRGGPSRTGRRDGLRARKSLRGARSPGVAITGAEPTGTGAGQLLRFEPTAPARRDLSFGLTITTSAGPRPSAAPIPDHQLLHELERHGTAKGVRARCRAGTIRNNRFGLTSRRDRGHGLRRRLHRGGTSRSPGQLGHPVSQTGCWQQAPPPSCRRTASSSRDAECRGAGELDGDLPARQPWQRQTADDGATASATPTPGTSATRRRER